MSAKIEQEEKAKNIIFKKLHKDSFVPKKGKIIIKNCVMNWQLTI